MVPQWLDFSMPSSCRVLSRGSGGGARALWKGLGTHAQISTACHVTSGEQLMPTGPLSLTIPRDGGHTEERGLGRRFEGIAPPRMGSDHHPDEHEREEHREDN